MKFQKTPLMFMLPALAALDVQPSNALAQGTAFTYEGQLLASGASANGTNFSMAFYVYNSASGGSPLGTTAIASVTVSNGLFLVPLDFGNIFDGTARWLEVSVRRTGPGGDAGFTTLAPRQQILSSPYAIQALNASNLLGNISPLQINGQIAPTQLPAMVLTNNQAAVNLSGVFVGNGAGLTNLSAPAFQANVALLNSNQTFSGSNTFLWPVILSGAAPALKLAGPGGGGAHATLDLSTYDPRTNGPSARIQTTDNNSSSDWDFLGKIPGADTNPLVSLLHIAAGGYVGIGTTNPAASLHVTEPQGAVALFDSSSSNGTFMTLRNTYGAGTNWQIISTPNSALYFVASTGPSPLAPGIAALILTTNGEAFVTKNVRFVDNTYASRGAEPLRIVRGTVNTNGSIVAGAGFGVSHTNGTGAYVITFSQAFGGTPTVTTSAVNFVTKSGSVLTPGSVTVATVDFSGHAQDDAFSFTALGPP